MELRRGSQMALFLCTPKETVYHSAAACFVINLLSRWLLRHGTLVVYLKITGKRYSKSQLIRCIIIKKHQFQYDDEFVKTLKVSPQFNFSSGTRTDFGGGCLQN